MRYLVRPPMGVLLVVLTLGAVSVMAYRSGGSMFNPGPLSAQERGTALGGVHSHAELASQCSACHVSPWSRETMADRCLSCHADIREEIAAHHAMHGNLSQAASQCRACHTEHKGVHAPLTNMTKFDHDLADFKLTGAHKAVDCKSCHKNDLFRGTPQNCSSCHAEPQVHLGKFGTDCAACHSTATWHGATVNTGHGGTFDHNRTRFKLTGAHETTECKRCHVNNVFAGTPLTCVGCHAEPKVHLGKFGTECASCHSTITWKGVELTATTTNFDHDKTAFKLTGVHKTTDCKGCHSNGTFKGTPTTCVGCHAEPVVHKGKYGTDCANCHQTATWKDSTFKHVFPVEHGGRRNSTGNANCARCHDKAPDYHTYTCYGCHEHEKTRMEQRHARRKITGAKLDACASCHKTVRKGNRAEGPQFCPRIELAQDIQEPVAVAMVCTRDCGAAPGGSDADDILFALLSISRPAGRELQAPASPLLKPVRALAYPVGEPAPAAVDLRGLSRVTLNLAELEKRLAGRPSGGLE
jgi:hypothetical protein